MGYKRRTIQLVTTILVVCTLIAGLVWLCPGSVSGRAFFISRGGELYPARSATIRLLHGRVDAKTLTNKEGVPSDRAYDECKARLGPSRYRELADMATGETKGGLALKVVDYYCGAYLTKQQVDYFFATHTKSSQEIEADENGVFKVRLWPGEYTAVATGRAGTFSVILRGELQVRPFASVDAKISNVIVALPDAEGFLYQWPTHKQLD